MPEKVIAPPILRVARSACDVPIGAVASINAGSLSAVAPAEATECVTINAVPVI